MRIEGILKTVQFVVDQEGKPRAAVLEMPVWEILLTLLEELEDRELIHERLTGWRAKMGWTRWAEFAAGLDKDTIPAVIE
jgi:hypothetical protein